MLWSGMNKQERNEVRERTAEQCILASKPVRILVCTHMREGFTSEESKQRSEKAMSPKMISSVLRKNRWLRHSTVFFLSAGFTLR